MVLPVSGMLDTFIESFPGSATRWRCRRRPGTAASAGRWSCTTTMGSAGTVRRVALPVVVEPIDVAFFWYEYTVGIAEDGVNPLYDRVTDASWAGSSSPNARSVPGQRQPARGRPRVSTRP